MGANNSSNFPVDTDTFTSDDWKEKIAAFQPGGGDVFSTESSEAILVGEIPWAKRFSFIRAVLGYAQIKTLAAGGLNYLSRELPLFHPWYDWMSAHSVSIHPYRPDGSSLKNDPLDPDLSFPYAGYEYAEATIRFKQQPWVFKTDDEVTRATEYDRYCYDPERSAQLEILSQTGKQLTFAEGTASDPLGIALASELSIPISKEQFHYKWMHVPRDWILSGVTGEVGYQAKKITPRLGMLNNAEFLGFRTGTLLLSGVQFERFLWPLRTVGDSPYGYNVTFQFTAFDPDKGAVSSYYGHNLQPWKGDNKWYYATDDGTTGGTPFLPSTDFTKLFEYVND